MRTILAAALLVPSMALADTLTCGVNSVHEPGFTWTLDFKNDVAEHYNRETDVRSTFTRAANKVDAQGVRGGIVIWTLSMTGDAHKATGDLVQGKVTRPCTLTGGSK